MPSRRLALAAALGLLPGVAAADAAGACRGDPPAEGDAFLDVRIEQTFRGATPGWGVVTYRILVRGTVALEVEAGGRLSGRGELFVCEASAAWKGGSRIEPRRTPLAVQVSGRATESMLEGTLTYGDGAQLEPLATIPLQEGTISLEPQMHAALDVLQIVREPGAQARASNVQPFEGGIRTERTFEYWPAKVVASDDPFEWSYEAATDESGRITGGGAFFAFSRKENGACVPSRSPKVTVVFDRTSSAWRIEKVAVQSCSLIHEPFPWAEPGFEGNIVDEPDRGVRDLPDENKAGKGHAACVAQNLLLYPKDEQGSFDAMRWWIAQGTTFHEGVHLELFEAWLRKEWKTSIRQRLRAGIARWIALVRPDPGQAAGVADKARKELAAIVADLEVPSTEREAYRRTWESIYEPAARRLRGSGGAGGGAPKPCPVR